MQPAGHHIAELNIGRLIGPQTDPRVAEFIEATAKVNALAERMPGFVWRLTESDGIVDPASPAATRDLVNMSVWEDVEALEGFVWNTVHRAFYERRAEWFELLSGMSFVMWYVPAGHVPTLDEAMARLAHRGVHSDTDHAFGWSHLKDARLWQTHTCARQAAE